MTTMITCWGPPSLAFPGLGPPKMAGGVLCRVRFLSQTRDAVVGITAESTPQKWRASCAVLARKSNGSAHFLSQHGGGGTQGCPTAPLGS